VNSAILIGIQANGGTATYQNNMISIACDTSGTGVNNGAVINGINENRCTNILF